MDIYDRRRKMADRLRHSVACVRPGDELCDQEVLAVLCVGPGHHEGYSDAEDVLRLADLIDRPTCRAVQTAPGDFYACSECGHDGWADADSVTRFCPDCGAEVVRDE